MTGKLSLDAQEYKDLCESSNDLMQSVTPDGHFRYVNNTWRQVLGYSQREVAAMTIWDIIHPDELEHCRELFMNVLSGEDVALVATAFVTRDGRKILVEGSVNCHFAGGKPVYTRAIFRDVTRRRQVEEEIGKFKTITDEANYGIVMIDLETSIIIYTNKTFARMHGYADDQLIGCRYSVLFTGEQLKEAEKFKDGALAEVDFGARELWRMRKDGSVFPTITKSIVVKDNKDKPLFISATAIDITERKRIEEKLQHSEESLKTYLESAPDGIYIIDLKGTFLYGNKKAEEIMGYKREELIGKSFLNLKLLPAKDLAKAGKLLALNAIGKPTGPDEFELVRKDRSHVSVEINTTPIKQGKGTVIIGLVRDITERKRTGEELIILKQAVDTSGEAIFLTDRDGIITFLNPAFTELYGYTADEIVGKVTPRILKSGQMKPEDYELFWKTLLDRQIVTGELLNKNKDGVIRVIEGSANSVIDDKGNIIGFLAVQRDITEHKQAEDTLRESEERYRTLLELSGEIGEAVIMLQDTSDKKAVHAFATREWPRITGYSMKELLGMSWFELLHPDYGEAAFERYLRRIDGEVIPGLFEMAIVRKDGTEVPVEITGGPTTYRGKPALVVYARDITGPKKAEQEREKLIQELQKTLQEVKTLSGLLPICAWCKKLRDDEGYWKSVEEYLGEHTRAEFTHGICPECAAEFSDRG